MLSSITPLGERSRKQHFAVTAVFLLVGASVAAAALGALLGGLGAQLPLSSSERLAALGVAAALGLTVDLLFPGGVPTHLRQVDERWLRRYRGWVYGLGFGAQLGVGVATVVTTSAVYLTILGEAFAPSILAGAVIGALFGGIRGASVLLAAQVDTPARLLDFHRRISALERPASAAVLAAQAVLAAVAIGVVL
ncbi:MAG: hypothetical protein WAL31_02065 [Gaiellaceae bacterium]